MFNVINKRKTVFIISFIFIVISILFLLFGRYNYGIDMTGGTQTEYTYTNSTIDIPSVNSRLQDIAKDYDTINSINAYKITGENKFVVETGFISDKDETDVEAQKLSARDLTTKLLSETYPDLEQSNYKNVGASFGEYIKSSAIKALIIAIIGITLYIAYAFSGTVSGISPFSFGLITIVTLFFDVFGSAGMYIALGQIFGEFKIDTFFVAALLTILGYSVNDTIVIFDRIRSNLKEFGGKGKELDEIVNLSLSQVLRRSIYTSVTMVIVLIIVFFVGPETIRGFTVAMMLGTIVGTYSSIFLASPLLYHVNRNKTLKVYKKIEMRDEDKIVV